mgnify:CR=1 FL=1
MAEQSHRNLKEIDDDILVMNALPASSNHRDGHHVSVDGIEIDIGDDDDDEDRPFMLRPLCKVSKL